MAERHMTEFRSGLGFDVHRAAVGRALFLGGVRFPGETGLLGHSDGDVVCHALADALLGAAALGDVGEHFPEGDPAVEGIAGMDLLARTVALVRVRDLIPHSVDVTVIAERPAIAPAREEMKRNVAATLRVGVDRVSVKATRPEGLGLTGDGIGCIALAVLTGG
jgi:2-C-methyl-D-erythritol 2,4-cyclodiphosphate synthase